MPGIARQGDSITGQTKGEHHGHYDEEGNPIHKAGPLTGTIASNCSTKVFSGGKAVAFVGSVTDEKDDCGPGKGTVSSGSSKVFVGGKAVARNGDKIQPHNGTANISSGSSKVIVS